MDNRTPILKDIVVRMSDIHRLLEASIELCKGFIVLKNVGNVARRTQALYFGWARVEEAVSAITTRMHALPQAREYSEGGEPGRDKVNAMLNE